MNARSTSLLAVLLCIAATCAHATLPFAVDGKELPSLAPMLAQTTPAVVNIAVSARSQEDSNPLLRDPFFRRFFGIPEVPRQRQAAGSGVIVDAARGLVLTNHHVIKDARTIEVVLKDRRTFKAELVGSDPGTDIALLRIPAERLSALKLTDSDQVNVGDFVVAIGNPFGIGQTVTSGIVSAIARSGLSLEGYEEFIQTDASINPGNSGGALVNLRGELIGINTAILGPSGSSVGIGFAVPVNMARAVMEQILRFGEVRRGKLGVSTKDLTPDLALQHGLNVTEGALVDDIEEGGAAQRAGLRIKDVVIAINERPVRSSSELRNRIALTPIGEEIDLEVLRGTKNLHLRARVAEPYLAINIPGKAVPQLAGAKVASLEPGMPMYGRVEAVVVTTVEPNSAAFRNGLRVGDLIFGVNTTRVREVKTFLQVLQGAETPIRLQLLRGDYRISLLIR